MRNCFIGDYMPDAVCCRKGVFASPSSQPHNVILATFARNLRRLKISREGREETKRREVVRDVPVEAISRSGKELKGGAFPTCRYTPCHPRERGDPWSAWEVCTNVVG